MRHALGSLLAQHRVNAVEASLGPWIGCHGSSWLLASTPRPASISWPWVATRPSSMLMKNPATPIVRPRRTPAAWRRSRRFDRWLRARGMAEKTRRAYGVDLGELARLGGRARALARRRRPRATCAASPPCPREAGAVTTDGRAQAGRDPHVLPAPGRARRARAEPGRPRLPAPRGPVPAAGAQADEVAQLLDADPGDDAARDARPRDVRAGLLVRAALRGDREPRPRRADSDAEQLRVLGKGVQDPLRAGRRAGRARARALPRARGRPALDCGRAPSRRCSSPRPAGGCRPRTSAAGCGCGCARAACGRHLAARPAPLLRHPPARGRCRPAHDPGAAGPRQSVSTTQLYTRVESGRLRRRTREPPARVT